ncbi:MULTISPECIES: hypothetical protein [Vagococcus]|uniref:Uncharacterized protein n=1 Tax=Vagococcus fluvialis bH819 TaxID=1255619 RepID=A0A1X6WMT8_9ENTE|nr:MULTISPECIES: hypothetical protein [Vagococcus]SLM85600.1 hypothetical protein FM121_05830 [Vagococcus fluvialis bH819]HCM89568.1 hypothetical protein [Vagococcus sp.]
MGGSIIYVGSREISREDYYQKKDNWGMYRNIRAKDINLEEEFYNELISFGKRFAGVKKHKEYCDQLERKYGLRYLNRKNKLLILKIYKESYVRNPDKLIREEMIYLNLIKNLNEYKLDMKIQESLFSYAPLFNSIKANIKK